MTVADDLRARVEAIINTAGPGGTSRSETVEALMALLAAQQGPEIKGLAEAEGREPLTQHFVQVTMNGHPYTRYSYVAQNAEVERSRAERYARSIAREAVDRALSETFTALAPSVVAEPTTKTTTSDTYSLTPKQLAKMKRRGLINDTAATPSHPEPGAGE